MFYFEFRFRNVKSWVSKYFFFRILNRGVRWKGDLSGLIYPFIFLSIKTDRNICNPNY